MMITTMLIVILIYNDNDANNNYITSINDYNNYSNIYK